MGVPGAESDRRQASRNRRDLEYRASGRFPPPSPGGGRGGGPAAARPQSPGSRVSRLGSVPPPQPGGVVGGQRQSRSARRSEGVEVRLLSRSRFGASGRDLVRWLRAIIAELAPSARSLGVKLCG